MNNKEKSDVKIVGNFLFRLLWSGQSCTTFQWWWFFLHSSSAKVMRRRTINDAWSWQMYNLFSCHAFPSGVPPLCSQRTRKVEEPGVYFRPSRHFHYHFILAAWKAQFARFPGHSATLGQIYDYVEIRSNQNIKRSSISTVRIWLTVELNLLKRVTGVTVFFLRTHKRNVKPGQSSRLVFY